MLLRKRVEFRRGRHCEGAATACNDVGRGRGPPPHRRLEQLAPQQRADQVTEKCVARSEWLLDVDHKGSGFKRPVGGNRNRPGAALLEYRESAALPDESDRSRERMSRVS